jgi:dipeptidyl aminopeptidase/acylaminoacyl peptidase
VTGRVAAVLAETRESTRIVLLANDGSVERRLTGGGEIALAPSWSADEREIVFYAAGDEERLHVLAVEDGTRRTLALDPTRDESPCATREGFVESGDGTSLYCVVGDSGPTVVAVHGGPGAGLDAFYPDLLPLTRHPPRDLLRPARWPTPTRSPPVRSLPESIRGGERSRA